MPGMLTGPSVDPRQIDVYWDTTNGAGTPPKIKHTEGDHASMLAMLNVASLRVKKRS